MSRDNPREKNIFLNNSGERKKVGFVDVSQNLEDRARDIAEARILERYEKEDQDIKGKKGFLTKLKQGFRNWKRSAKYEFERQKEIIKARTEIEQSGNLFLDKPGSDKALTDQAKAATVERMVADHEELIHRGPQGGEDRAVLNDPQIKQTVQNLVREYARPGSTIPDKVAFDTARNSAFAQLARTQNLPPGIVNQGVGYADNMFKIAEHARAAVEHGLALDQLDLDFDLIVAQARMGVKTEAKLTWLDKRINWLKKSRLGAFVSEAGIALGAAAVYTTAQFISKGIVRTTLKTVAFGGGAIAGGLFAAAKEGKRLKEERSQHARERSQGKSIKPDSPRRQEMEQYMYESRAAQDLTAAIENLLYRVNANGEREARNDLTQDEFDSAMNNIAEIEGRVRLSINRKIDLISYSDVSKVDEENTNLELSKARAKAHLRQLITSGNGNFQLPPGQTFDQHLDRLTTDWSSDTERLDLTAKDKAFNKMKRNRMIKRGLIVAGSSIVIGGVVQQVGAWGSDAGHHIAGAPITRADTVLEKGWHMAFPGQSQEIPFDPEHIHPENITLPGGGNVEVKIPDGTHLVQDGDHFYLTDDSGKHLMEDIRFNPDGSLTDDTTENFDKQHWYHNDAVDPGEHSTQDYWQDKLSKNPRVDWHDEPGPRYSNFFHKLIEFEGKQQMLYVKRDANGNVFIDLHAMMNNIVKNADSAFKKFGVNPDGSFDSKLKHLHDQIIAWNKSGELHQHFRLAIIPTDDANHKGLSMIAGSADSHGIIPLAKELSDRFIDEKSLHYRYHPFRFMEARFNTPEGDHTFATTIGQNAAPFEVQTAIHHPEFGPPVGDWLDHPWDMPPAIPIDYGRRPMEAMKTKRYKGDYFGGYGYGYHGSNPEMRRRWEEQRSPRLTKNPDAHLSQQKEIDWFFETQLRERGQNYINEIDNYVAQNERLNHLSPNTRIVVCMPVAAAQEMNNIYQTLSLYAQQDQESLDKTVILMNINWPDDADQTKINKTLEEIHRAERDFPNVQIAYFTKQWSRTWITEKDGKIYGEVVKHLNDTALRAIQKANLNQDAYLLTNDADAQGMAKHYFRALLRGIEKTPDKDGFLGKIEWNPDLYDSYPGFHVAMRMYQFIDTAYRHAFGPYKSIASSGPNFMCKASIFAGVGGYDSEYGAGADTDLGRRIRAARLGTRQYIPEEKYPIQYNNGAWIDTDPSRSLRFYKEGLPIIDQWSYFDEGGYQPRGDLSIEGAGGENLDTDFDKIVERTQFQISSMVDQWIGFDNKEIYTQTLNYIFPPQPQDLSDRKAPREQIWQVIKQSVTEKGQTKEKNVVVLTDLGKQWLKKQLQNYKTGNKKDLIYKRGVRRGGTRTADTSDLTDTTDDSDFDSEQPQPPGQGQGERPGQEEQQVAEDLRKKGGGYEDGGGSSEDEKEKGTKVERSEEEKKRYGDKLRLTIGRIYKLHNDEAFLHKAKYQDNAREKDITDTRKMRRELRKGHYREVFTLLKSHYEDQTDKKKRDGIMHLIEEIVTINSDAQTARNEIIPEAGRLKVKGPDRRAGVKKAGATKKADVKARA